MALDSLRGLAALSVVIYHGLLVHPSYFWVLGGEGNNVFATGRLDVLLFTATPPSLLWSGREAVLLFFVLSGFVLSLAFQGPRRPRYLPFVARRACRLLLPSAAVVVAVALVVQLVGNAPRPGLSIWFNEHSWGAMPDWRMLVRHMLLIGTDYPLNNVLWTLHYEWHASLLFPAVFALAAAGLRIVLPVMLAVLLVVTVEATLTGWGYLSTLYFLLYFLFGAVVATQRGWLVPAVHGLPRAGRVVLWLLAYLLLNIRWLLPGPESLFDLKAGLGAALLILLVLASARAQALLMVWPLPWLGPISFALYLVHVPTILAVLRVVPPAVPVPLAVMAAALLSLGLAALLHRWVERPAIRLGHAVAARL